MFISIEGLDGSGKTTQAQRLYEWLSRRGHDVLLTREPGGTPIGEQIRGLLHDLDNTAMQPATELLLYNASRAQLVAEELRPQLERGGIALCDRFADSTLAYQGYGHGQDLERLRHVIAAATGGLQPDLTIFLDIAPREALERRRMASLFGDEWNRLDDYEIAFHERVYAGYRELVAAEAQRWLCVDARRPILALQQELRAALAGRLPEPLSLDVDSS
ncbi:MAG: dTMP kinase [Anaerolineaceae bacterium]|nr:dTMP kinase [Anaerolineaceae bacterium]